MTVWLIHFVEPVEGAKTPTGAPAVTSSSTTRLLIAGDEIKGQCLWLWDIFPVVSQDADNSLNTFIMLELWLQVAGCRRLLTLTWLNALERYEPMFFYTSTDFVWNNNAATVTLASSNLFALFDVFTQRTTPQLLTFIPYLSQKNNMCFCVGWGKKKIMLIKITEWNCVARKQV